MVALNSNNVPPDHVLEWCRVNVINLIKDGGVWGIPRSGTVFRVDKKKKQLVLIVPGMDNGADFDATKHVFKWLGWDVVEEDSDAVETG